VDAAELRLEAAEQKADEFARERARQLLAELEAEAVAIADDSNRWAAQAAELKRRWNAHQRRTDELVGLIPGASPRYDCPPSEYPLASVFKELERCEEVRPYVPHWTGLAQREQLNGVHRLLRLKRRQASEAQVEARTARD
jgi:hypothetical protein